MPSMYDSGSLLAAPIGSVLTIPASGVPTGYLLCDGSALSKATYATLFNAIGTAHGEPIVAGANFNIPDYRGRFLRMADNGTTRDPDRTTRTAMNANGALGNNIGTLQPHQFGAHNHDAPIVDPASSVNIYNLRLAEPSTPVSNANFTARNLGSGLPYSEQVLAPGATLFNQGGNESRPLNAYVNVMIRAF